jgi:membrane-associated protein
VPALVDFLLHSDKHLLDFVATYGVWVYGILFAIVFAETGFVVTPFLPGDSLLFAVGALSATGVLNGWVAFALLFAAAFLGNTVNYAVGRAIGSRVIGADPGRGSRLINPAYVLRAHAFFERYGGKAVVLARFVPIVRTFMPFVAGAAEMGLAPFMLYTLAGAAGWVALCMGAGVLFGNIPVVKNNFSLVTIGIVGVSLLPMLIEFLRHRSKSPQSGT